MTVCDKVQKLTVAYAEPRRQLETATKAADNSKLSVGLLHKGTNAEAGAGDPEEPASVNTKGANCCRGRLRSMVILVAAVMVQVSLGVSICFGNYMPYLTSYLRNMTSATSLDYSHSLWIDNSNWMATAATMPLFGLVESRMPKRFFLFIGFLFFSSSFLGSYFAVQTSFAATVLVLGVMQGVGQSILWPGSYNIALMWFPEKKGVVGGIAMAGYGAGGFAWTQIFTNWINPQNMQPDLHVDGDVYFTQPEVLTNVPSCFLLLGGVLSGVLVLSLACLSEPPAQGNNTNGRALETITIEELSDSDETQSEADAMRVTTSTDKTRSKTQQNMAITDEEARQPEREGLLTGQELLQYQKVNKVVKCIDSNRENSEPRDTEIALPSTDGKVDRCSRNSKCATEDEPQDYTPLQILRSRAAWTSWFFNFFVDLSFVFVLNFYKTYGQTFIRDDRFLSLTGSVASFSYALGQLSLGWLADRFGLLTCMLLTQALLTVSALAMLACQYAGPSLFFIVINLVRLAFGGVYSLQCLIVFVMFGPRYFTFSYGFVSTTPLLSSLLPVFVASAAKDAFGWTGVYLAGAAAVFLGLVLNASLLLDCGHPIPPRMKKDLLDRRCRCSRPRGCLCA